MSKVADNIYRFEWKAKLSKWRFRLDIIPSDISGTWPIQYVSPRPTNIITMPPDAILKWKYGKKLDKYICGITQTPYFDITFNINKFSFTSDSDNFGNILYGKYGGDQPFTHEYFVLSNIGKTSYWDNWYYGNVYKNFSNEWWAGNIFELFIDYTGVGDSYQIVYRGLQTQNTPLTPNEKWEMDVSTIDANASILQFLDLNNLNQMWRVHSIASGLYANFVCRQAYYDWISGKNDPKNHDHIPYGITVLPSLAGKREDNHFFWFFRIHDLSLYIDAIATEIGKLVVRDSNYTFTSNLEYMIQVINGNSSGSHTLTTYYKQAYDESTHVGDPIFLNDSTYIVDSSGNSDDIWPRNNKIYTKDLYYLGNVSDHDNNHREDSVVSIQQGGFHENCIKDYKNGWDLIYDLAQASLTKCQFKTGTYTGFTNNNNYIDIHALYDKITTITLKDVDIFKLNPIEFGSDIINKGAISISDTQDADIGNVNVVNTLSRNQKDFTLPIIFHNIPVATQRNQIDNPGLSGERNYGTITNMIQSIYTYSSTSIYFESYFTTKFHNNQLFYFDHPTGTDAIIRNNPNSTNIYMPFRVHEFWLQFFGNDIHGNPIYGASNIYFSSGTYTVPYSSKFYDALGVFDYSAWLMDTSNNLYFQQAYCNYIAAFNLLKLFQDQIQSKVKFSCFLEKGYSGGVNAFFESQHEVMIKFPINKTAPPINPTAYTNYSQLGDEYLYGFSQEIEITGGTNEDEIVTLTLLSIKQ
jgi:hypothetical protein